MEIFKALSAINQEIEPIKKQKENKQQGFMYRGIDQVMNELHALFMKYKVIITNDIVSSSREERQTKSGGTMLYSIIDYRFTFWAVDGSSIFTTVRGEGMDSGDKSSNKAISVALKYALTVMFLIPTDELVDPDGESPEIKQKTEPKTEPKQEVKKEWMSEAQLKSILAINDKEKVQSYLDYFSSETHAMKKVYKEQIINHLNSLK